MAGVSTGFGVLTNLFLSAFRFFFTNFFSASAASASERTMVSGMAQAMLAPLKRESFQCKRVAKRVAKMVGRRSLQLGACCHGMPRLRKERCLGPFSRDIIKMQEPLQVENDQCQGSDPTSSSPQHSRARRRSASTWIPCKTKRASLNIS